VTAQALVAAALVALAVLATGRPRPPRPARPTAPPPPGRDPASSGLPGPSVGRTASGDRWLRPTAAAAAWIAGALVVGGALGFALGLVAAGTAWVLVGRMEPPAARRRRERLEAALPTVVDLMAASLSGGQAPGAALAQVAAAVSGPVAEELTVVAARVRLGVDPVRVWQDLGRHPQLGPLGRTVARALDGGASVAEGMSRLAEELRRESRASVEGRARAVGVKAALPLGLCMLPAFVLTGVVPLVVGSLGTLGRP
jgi:Flp pilus assembly protein TadB